jgi:hypothetical protein
MRSNFLTTASVLVFLALTADNAARAQDVAPAPDTDAHYQAQQQQYQQQLDQNAQEQQQYQKEKQVYQDRRANYQDQRGTYEALRDHYAAERARYHRYEWPARFAEWRLKSDSSLMNVRVHLINGDTVGNVLGAAHAQDGVIEALQVMLDDRSIVWIDANDIRFDQFNGTVITDLYASDIRAMARERIG